MTGSELAGEYEIGLTGRERLLKTLRGEIPDCVPVAPDFSNMIPCRLTGLPFWDIYLYNKITPWDAYIDCAKHFDIDALMDGYFPLEIPWDDSPAIPWETHIVKRSDSRIITQKSYIDSGKRVWHDKVDVYYIADSPSLGVDPQKVGLSPVPDRYEPLEGVSRVDCGPEGLRKVKERMGSQGLVGIFLASSCAIGCEEDVYRYYDMDESERKDWAHNRVERVERGFDYLMSLDVKPDFLCVGGSGTLVLQTLEMFREIAYPAVKRAIELAGAAGFMTHVHSCGPEAELVRVFAEETELTIIDPLEIPPMGDCDLADLKRRFGDRLTLKGNLHTTNVMLRGSVEDVIAASKKAIDDAAEGGRFILSTGDQCGRDTPDENLHAMVETARTYGRYAVRP